MNENCVAAQVLDEASKREVFNWRDTVDVVDPTSQNQTWSDVLHSTARNHNLAFDCWCHEIDRLTSGLKFPQEWFDARMIMIQTKNECKEDYYLKMKTS